MSGVSVVCNCERWWLFGDVANEGHENLHTQPRLTSYYILMIARQTKKDTILTEKYKTCYVQFVDAITQQLLDQSTPSRVLSVTRWHS